MLTGIDHIVIVAADLEIAIKNYAALGFTVVRGGKHPIGTHNALIGLADGAYIELVAFYQPGVEHAWFDWLQRGGGITDVCLATGNLRADIESFRSAGIVMTDPSPLSRIRPDGYRLDWVLSIPQGPYRGVVPFLIEDETPRQERVPRQTGHSNRVTGIRSLTIAVSDVDTIRRWYGSLLAGNPDQGRDIESQELRASGVCFNVGPHSFNFLAPSDNASPLASWLKERGPSIYSAALTSDGGRAGSLDEKMSLGARLRIE
jgi:catechol 2,3-dioxygenase-like lactoylglutathione lyase family enzyme